MPTTTRILWIDYVKASAIAIVVLLHLGTPDPYRTVARSFVIPLFFLLSGMFSRPEKYPTWKCFLQHKTLRLLIPYVIFNAITYLYWLAVGRNMGADATVLIPWWKPMVGAMFGLEHWMEHCKPLWFLPCLIIAEVMFYTSYRLTYNRKGWLTILMIILFACGISLSLLRLPPLPYAIGGAMSMSIFYYLGYLLDKYTCRLQKLRDMVSGNTLYWLLACIVSMCSCVCLSLQTSETRVFENTYGNIFFAFPAACMGCIGVAALCILLFKLFPPIRLLSYIGTHTMPILAFHLMIASVVKGITYFALQLPLSIYSEDWVKLFFTVAILLLSVPVCYFYDWIQKKWKQRGATSK